MQNNAGAANPTDGYDEMLQRLLDNPMVDIVSRDPASGTITAFNRSTGQRVFFGISAGLDTFDEYKLRTQKKSEENPTVNYEIPKEPGISASVYAWIDYYYECRERGVPIKWKDIEKSTGIPAGTLRKKAYDRRNSNK